MEYHCGICIKESNWIVDCYNSIVILAGDRNDHKLSFFIKIFEKEEGVNDNVKNIKFGSAVFFTAEKENIIDLFDVDCIFSQGPLALDVKGIHIHLRYYSTSGLEVGIYNDVNFRSFLPKSLISDVEKKLMNSLYKGRLYKRYLNSVQNITAEKLQNIIIEEEKEVEVYDINDLVKELKISYYANNFYIRTDEPEEYDLNERYTFELTKYEDCKFDTYLLQLLNIGERLIEEQKGWFYAKEEAYEDVEFRTKNIPYVKREILRNYSKSEHLNYRVRSRLSNLMYPLFMMLFISEKPLCLKKYNFDSSIHGYSFISSCNNDKKQLLFDVQRQNETLRYDCHNKLKTMIYSSFDLNKILNEWCIPFPIFCNKRI